MTSAREGTFLATPVDWSVRDSRNGLPEFVCRFTLDAEYDAASHDFVDCSAEGMEVIDSWNLVYMKGNKPVRNEINVSNLEVAIGWPDRDVRTLNDSDWSKTQVQLKLADEEYNGKTRLRVKYINPRDYQPGIKKANPDSLAKMAATFGAVLKAGIARAAQRPASSPATPRPAANPSPTEQLREQAKRDAWAKFNALAKPSATVEEIADAWRKAIANYFGEGTTASQLGRQQWESLIADNFQKRAAEKTAPDVPADDGGDTKLKEDDIPF